MKRAYLCLLLLMHAVQIVHAQINWGDYSQSFTDEDSDNDSRVGIILAIPKDNNSFWVNNADSKYFTALEKDSSFAQSHPKNIIARTTFDTARAQFFLKGVNYHNANAYQYRVIEYPGNKVLVPWKAISQYTDSSVIKSSGLPQMAYLGGYKTDLGKMLIMDVRKKDSQQIVATSLIAWEPIKPMVSRVYTSDEFDEFLKLLQYPWARTDLSRKRHQLGDLKLSSTNTNLIFPLEADIYHKEQVQYELMRNGSVFIPWKTNDYDNSFVWLKDFPPGEYLLKIRYSAQPQHVSEYDFEVEPTWYQTNLFRIVAVIFIAVLLGALLFLTLFVRQKRKAQQELANKNKIQLELKYLYAQLNPHFVFNSLSSIQGLINRQDINSANIYLSEFAALMRESLNRSNKEETSMNEELKTLETYLKLEQLRFGFQYTIDLDENINIYETSLPTLLLQPLVENAIKHGISHLHETGIINIRFDKKGNALKIIITDNGKGFNVGNSSCGYGLKLTSERIKLLNKLNKEQPITFEINSKLLSGTQIIISFNYWFL